MHEQIGALPGGAGRRPHDGVLRARIAVAREAGHAPICALAFALRLWSESPGIRARRILRPCFCEDRRGRWSPAVRWFVCWHCGREYVARRQARRSHWCSDACRRAAYRHIHAGAAMPNHPCVRGHLAWAHHGDQWKCRSCDAIRKRAGRQAS